MANRNGRMNSGQWMADELTRTSSHQRNRNVTVKDDKTFQLKLRKMSLLGAKLPIFSIATRKPS